MALTPEQEQAIIQFLPYAQVLMQATPNPADLGQLVGFSNLLLTKISAEEKVNKLRQEQVAATQAKETEIQAAQAELAALQAQLTDTIG